MVSIRCLTCTLKHDRVSCNSYFSFFLSHTNFNRPYSLSLDYGGETSFLVSYLCLHKRSLAWAEFLRCMGQNGHGQNSDGVIRVCTSSFSLRRAKIALLFIERLGFADLRSVYFSPGAFVLIFTGGDFLRIGLINWSSPILFVLLSPHPGFFFLGKDFTIFILFRVWYFLFLWRFTLLVQCWGDRIRLLV